MDSSTEEETPDEVEIQKALASIRQITLKIKSELDHINDLIKHNGLLHVAVAGANEKLTSVAIKMGIDVKNLTTGNDNSNEQQINLPHLQLTQSFKEKLLTLASD